MEQMSLEGLLSLVQELYDGQARMDEITKKSPGERTDEEEAELDWLIKARPEFENTIDKLIEFKVERGKIKYDADSGEASIDPGDE